MAIYSNQPNSNLKLMMSIIIHIEMLEVTKMKIYIE